MIYKALVVDLLVVFSGQRHLRYERCVVFVLGAKIDQNHAAETVLAIDFDAEDFSAFVDGMLIGKLFFVDLQTAFVALAGFSEADDIHPVALLGLHQKVMADRNRRAERDLLRGSVDQHRDAVETLVVFEILRF